MVFRLAVAKLFPLVLARELARFASANKTVRFQKEVFSVLLVFSEDSESEFLKCFKKVS
jgi:hypothetical protein